MKIATILPTEYLNLEAGSDYHMCLAHLLPNEEYRAFFEWQALRGAYIIMDNGVVETGEPLPVHVLLDYAEQAGVTEMTLPDKLNDRMVTLHLHKHALDYISKMSNQRVMLIPQGCNQEDWINSVKDMLALAKRYSNAGAIGISKFCVGPKLFDSRLDALNSVPELLQSRMDIHLLGCPNQPGEIHCIDVMLKGRIRGVDSGLPVFYTQTAKILTTSSSRPKEVELDFNQIFTAAEIVLLKRNIKEWKRIIHDKIITQWRCEG